MKVYFYEFDIRETDFPSCPECKQTTEYACILADNEHTAEDMLGTNRFLCPVCFAKKLSTEKYEIKKAVNKIND